VPLATVRDAGSSLRQPTDPNAQLRRVKDIDRDRLGPAIHAAISVATAVVRALRTPSAPILPPTDARGWREQIERAALRVSLDDLVGDLWKRGIPVIPVGVLPKPGFQGLACVVQGRPVIVLGQKYDEPGRLAFLVAHEAGHVAAGDCTAEQLIVDEDEAVADDSNMEHRADAFARGVLVGEGEIPALAARDFRDLANAAAEIEGRTGADAGVAIFSWAASTRDYATATQAVKALYRARGARNALRRHFDRHVDLEAASETDRALLRCVYGDPEQDAAAP
jgi:Zn-dependent peptidase ImmA (M78 family)